MKKWHLPRFPMVFQLLSAEAHYREEIERAQYAKPPADMDIDKERFLTYCGLLYSLEPQN